MVLAHEDAAPPEPTCMVRVLVTRRGAVLTRRRADGRGPDIPTHPVGDDSVAHTLQSVLAGLGSEVGAVRLLGWVRNVVDEPDPGYPWPTPEAYFAVWHCEVAPDSDLEGEWLQPGEAEGHLGERTGGRSPRTSASARPAVSRRPAARTGRCA